MGILSFFTFQIVRRVDTNRVTHTLKFQIIRNWSKSTLCRVNFSLGLEMCCTEKLSVKRAMLMACDDSCHSIEKTEEIGS